MTIQETRRRLSIGWREIRLTVNYEGSRREQILFWISVIFVPDAVSDFFARPQYEGQFVSSFAFFTIVLLTYVAVLTSLLRARAAWRKRKLETAKEPSLPSNSLSRVDE